MQDVVSHHFATSLFFLSRALFLHICKMHTRLCDLYPTSTDRFGPALWCWPFPVVAVVIHQPDPKSCRPVTHHQEFPTHRRANSHPGRDKVKIVCEFEDAHRLRGNHMTEDICELIDDHRQRASFFPAPPGQPHTRWTSVLLARQ